MLNSVLNVNSGYSVWRSLKSKNFNLIFLRS